MIVELATRRHEFEDGIENAIVMTPAGVLRVSASKKPHWSNSPQSDSTHLVLVTRGIQNYASEQFKA
jgi:hypothetical protein